MKYDVNLNEDLIVTNIYDLPDDSPVGHIFSFKFTDGSVKHAQCTESNGPFPCADCVFRNNTTCPWDPDAGEDLCSVYDCVFKSIEKVMENL